MVSRRSALHLLGAGLVGLAGCTGTTDDDPKRTATESAPSPASTTSTPTPTESSPDTGGVDVRGAEPVWARSFDARLHDTLVAVEGTVVAVTDSTIRGLDASTGETTWERPVPAEPERDAEHVQARTAVHDGTIYVLAGLGYGISGRAYSLFALEPDGTERWRYDSDLRRFHGLGGFGGGTAVLTTRNDALSTDGEQIIAVDLASGEEQWRSQSGDAYDGAVSGDLVTVEAANQVVDCFDRRTGERRFRFDPDTDAAAGESAIGGGRVFAAAPIVGEGEGAGPSLYALAPTDGTVEWAWDRTTVTNLRWAGDLYAGGDGIVRLSPDGTERWRYDDGGLVARVPFDREAIYTAAGRRVVAIERSSGRERWAAETTGRAIPRATGDGVVVSKDRQAATVLAHGTRDGAERWRARMPSEHGPTPTVSDGVAVVATQEGSVVGIPT